MALSGNKEQSFIAPGVSTTNYYWFDVSYVVNSQSVSDNYSNITVTLITWTTRATSNCSYNVGEYTIPTLKVNGSEKSIDSNKLYLDYRTCRPTKSDAKTLVTWTGNVPHNSDGTLTLDISAGMFYPGGGTSLTRGSYSITASFTIDPIARQWPLVINAGSGINISVKKRNSSGVYNITVNPGDILYPNDAIQIDYVIDEYYSLTSLKLNSTTITSVPYKVTLTNGATITAVTVRAPTKITLNTDISVSNVSDDADTITKQLNGNVDNIFIKYATHIDFYVEATTDQGATITSITEKYGRVFTNFGHNVIHAIVVPQRAITVVDSAGTTKTVTYDLSASPYEMVNYFNASGFLTLSWANSAVHVVAEFKCFTGKFGSNDEAILNQFTASGRYKKHIGGSWSSIIGSEFASISVDRDTGTVVVVADVPSTKVDYHEDYDFEITLNDTLTNLWTYVESYGIEQPLPCTINALIPKNIPVFDWGPNDFSFNVPVNAFRYNDSPTFGGNDLPYQSRCSVASNTGYALLGKKVEVNVVITISTASGTNSWLSYLYNFPVPKNNYAALNISRVDESGVGVYSAFVYKSGSIGYIAMHVQDVSVPIPSGARFVISGSYWTN